MTPVDGRRVRLVGIGAGHPDQLTVEAVKALNAADYAIVAQKSEDDPLVGLRRELLARHAPDLEVVPVRDPARNRSVEATGTRAGYEAAVTDWHEARAGAYEQVLLERPGEAVFLVWGDPAFYDSTVRIVERVLARGAVTFEWDVVPGISALQLLAARHRIVLHEVGQPIVVTTGRRLREAVDSGADNVLVMLNRALELDGLQDWHIWWGADLGTVSERLVSGPVGEVREAVERARAEVKAEAGWVMDVFLLRRR
ncbi:precorrin-6A synthase (deacetylating) [Aeromicrobium sp. CTD01-1L150]|uniref:precorrin-6A synthase (deacetylating) n=1 Tax=Aeromicrobium sp. CTD01-1L150 TaxID=3341830 RepID=UPI0035BF25A1